MDIIETFGIMIDVDGKNVDRELSSVVGNVKNKLSDLMLNVVTPVITGLASGQLVQQFTDEILQVDRLSKTLGVNIEQLQAWQGAAEAAGVAADEVGELFADLNDWMIDSAVNDSGAFERLHQARNPAISCRCSRGVENNRKICIRISRSL